MKHAYLLILLLVAEPGVLGADKQGNDVFKSEKLSFRITKPSRWFFETKDENPAPNKTVVSIAKFREPYDGLNPSCSIIAVPLAALPNRSTMQMSQAQIQKDKKAHADFVLVEGPKAVKVGGANATFFKATSTVTAEGRRFNALVRTYFVSGTGHMFKITMASPPEGSNVSEKEFIEILDSIKLNKD